jgi:hypothetical protein
MSRSILKSIYLEKPKCLIIWNGGNTYKRSLAWIKTGPQKESPIGNRNIVCFMIMEKYICSQFTCLVLFCLNQIWDMQTKDHLQTLSVFMRSKLLKNDGNRK